MTQPNPNPNVGQPGQPRQLRLELPTNLNSTYANAVMVTHTHSEIIMDFMQIMPNDPRARIQTRMVMTPANAKSFLDALKTNLERYEEKHGEISLPPKPISLADQLFGGLKTDESESESHG